MKQLFLIILLITISNSLSSQFIWDRHPDNPIMIGSQGAWDENFVMPGTVLFYEGIYHMYYDGGNDSGMGTGYATSSDGITWTPNVNNPILVPGATGEWDEGGIGDSHVIKLDSIFHLWYTGEDKDANFRIGHATSYDGLSWTKDPDNPVKDIMEGVDDSYFFFESPVVFDGNLFHMYYSTGKWYQTRMHLNHAFSEDGYNWTLDPENPIMQASDYTDYRTPEAIVYNGNQYIMFYLSGDIADWVFNVAISDDLYTWVDYEDNPVFTPGTSGSWESPVIGRATLLYDESENKYKMWYFGDSASNRQSANAKIGYAESSLRFFLDNNGVTIKCENCQPGDTGTVNGVLYEAVDRELLEQKRDEESDLTTLCTSLVTNLDSMFYSKTEFNQNIDSWDVSNVTSMSGVFAGQGTWYGDETHFNQDIGHWDVGRVTDMSNMFHSAIEFNQDIGAWDISNVTDMSGMFLQSYSFNQDIGLWDVSNVTNMSKMLQGSDLNYYIGSWDVSNVTDMSKMFAAVGMPDFSKDMPFNQDIGSWDVSEVSDMSEMFAGNKFFNQDLSNWCVENLSIEPENFAYDCPLQPEYYPAWGTCPSVYISQYEYGELFKIYPNPTNTLLTIEAEISEFLQVEISSLNGQLILCQQMEDATIQLDFSTFQKGVYLITIKSKESVTTKKIIKL